MVYPSLPILDSTREEPPEGEYYAHLHCFENSQWVGRYLARVQRLVKRQDSIVSSTILPTSQTHGEKFRDVGDERTMLGEGTLKWLISIKPSHLVY